MLFKMDVTIDITFSIDGFQWLALSMIDLECEAMHSLIACT
jgi:hypothetical protein